MIELLTLLLSWTIGFAVLGSEILRPPSIDVGPNSNIFKTNESLTMRCKASGTPQPTTYLWKKNGEVFDLNNRNIERSDDPTDGSFTLKYPQSSDEGFYQCLASNAHGTSVSRVAHMRWGALLHRPHSKQFLVNEGAHFVLQCQPDVLAPKNGVLYQWQLEDTRSGTVTLYPISRRVNTDNDGSLRFAHVIKDDAQDGKRYICKANNYLIDKAEGGSYANIAVAGRQTLSTKPTIDYFAPSNPIGFLGNDISLRCMFKGKPEVSRIEWTRRTGVLNTLRMTVDKLDTELRIRQLEFGDQDTYICKGINREGEETHEFVISVKAIPFFATPLNGPININASNGDTVVMHCNATAVPPATVQWYMNGQEVVSHDRILIDETKLTFSNVYKLRPNRSSDLTVIQCKASNDYGYVYGEGYINVLERTTITAPMESIVANYSELVRFKCSAKSDPSTPILYRWKNKKRSFTHDEGNVDIDQTEGTLTFLYPNDEALHCTYTCTADNMYTEKSTSANLTLRGTPVPPPPPVEKAQLWWIAVVVVAVLLLLLIVVLCCLWLLRNTGETYPVDEKERRSGHDPVKELEDDRFRDYSRKADTDSSQNGGVVNPTFVDEDNSRGSRVGQSAFAKKWKL